MKNLKKTFFSLSLLLLFSLSPALIQSLNGQAVNFKETFSFPGILNDCNGELIEFTGTFNVTLHYHDDNNGGFHLVEHTNLQNTRGIGDNGGVYRAVGLADRNVSGNFNSNGTQTFTVVIRQAFISRGSDDNIFFTGKFHITINANGDVVSFMDEPDSFECR